LTPKPAAWRLLASRNTFLRVTFDFLHSALSNVWIIFLVVLLFGGSIFVHELGHFLAARWRGVHVERFSIGFGPAIWSWRGRSGVEYRVSWFPVGGYVLLPQLADLSAVEGESRVDANKLPPVGYLSKILVFVAGATFNVLFAFALACIVWYIGQPLSSPLNSTTIAEVLPTVKNSAEIEVPSPASVAGLKSGDVILAIDGRPVTTFNEIVENLALSSGWNRAGERETKLTILRDGAKSDVVIHPVIGGSEKTRIIGITTVAKFVIDQVVPGSLADKAGLRAEDQIVAINGKPALTPGQFRDGMREAFTAPIKITVLRSGRSETVVIDAPKEKKLDLGLLLKTGVIFSHPSPWEQVWSSAERTVDMVAALVNPHSDIGLSHVQGPIGIISSFVDVSRAGMPFALWFTILVNVNLAILNLLPLPVLDGGQMVFATIARMRGRALPTTFIMTAQSVFFVLIFAMLGYISFFGDIPRMIRDSRAERAAEAAAAAQNAPATPAPAAAPTK
jgi:regulator of sigma E protease